MKIIQAQLCFNTFALESFNFPIRNTIRISLWTDESLHSTPSEIEFNKEEVSINEFVAVNISVIKGLDIKIGDSFNIGIYPNIIGKGTVSDIMEI